MVLAIFRGRHALRKLPELEGLVFGSRFNQPLSLVQLPSSLRLRDRKMSRIRPFVCAILCRSKQ